MSQCWFPDNTVLCNFGAVGQLELLEKILDTRGRWTEAVEYEAQQSSRYLPALGGSGLSFMGDSIAIEEVSDIERVSHLRRAVFGGTDANPLQHLGEAETCFLILNRDQYAGSRWITDDRDALEFAKANGILTWESWHLMSEGVANCYVDEHEAFDLLGDMRAKGRGLWIPPRPVDLRR